MNDVGAASAPRFAAAIGSRRWIATLSALTAVTALSIDMSLPAQPALVRTFGVPEETAGLTLSLFMVGFAAAQLVVGSLSDSWGRRPVMIGGLTLFTLAGIACALSPSIEVLLAFRIVQGAGAAAGPVVARAMVRDTQAAARAAQLLSAMLAALAIAPMIAPTIGGLLLSAFSWRAIFATLALFGALFLVGSHVSLVETHPPERRRTLSPGGVLASYRTLFTTRGTRLPLAIACASFAGQFAFIADSPFVLIEGYHVPTSSYGYYFAVEAFALMCGAQLGGRLLRAGRSPRGLIVLGTTLLVCGAMLAVILTQAAGLGLYALIASCAVYFVGVGITSPCAAALTMEPVPQIAGTASSTIGVLTMTSGALSGYLTTKIGGNSPTTLVYVMVVMAVLASLLSAIATTRHRRHVSLGRDREVAGPRTAEVTADLAKSDALE
jgi:MFS transporter, DHA1 family, multidrug resistance protein